MSSWPVHTLEEVRRVDPVIADVLENASLDFFDPPNSNVSWGLETEPLTGGRELRLVANQRVSRAWHAAFIKALSEDALERYGRFGAWPECKVTPQAFEPITVFVHMGESSEDDHRKIVDLVKSATVTANALVPPAAEECRRKQQELAQGLGLDKQRPGFSE